MKIIMIEPPDNIEEIIAKAAKMCYSESSVRDLIGKVEEQDQAAFIRKIIAIGHHSVLEHVSLHFAVEGVSRVLSHQLVRHRIASYSQQSQRYVALDKSFEYITPKSIANLNNNAKLSEKYDWIMSEIHSLYKEYIDAGVATEDARFILPNATETKVFFTMNIRSLLHFFKTRGCNRSQWEIREMAMEMLSQCRELSPIIFGRAGPDCVTRGCGEGSMTCGTPLTKGEI